MTASDDMQWQFSEELERQYKSNPKWEDAKDVIEGLDLAPFIALVPADKPSTGAREAAGYTMKAALESIAKNTCCDKCQEAALVAREALQSPEAGEMVWAESDNPGNAFNSFEALAADLLQFPSDEEIPPQMHGYLARWAYTFVKHHRDVTRAALKFTEGKMLPVPPALSRSSGET